MLYLYTALKVYPFWAIPIAMILAELAIFLKRRRSPSQFPFWSLVSFFLITSLLWFVFRGDIYSDQWVKTLSGLGLD